MTGNHQEGTSNDSSHNLISSSNSTWGMIYRRVCACIMCHVTDRVREEEMAGYTV